MGKQIDLTEKEVKNTFCNAVLKLRKRDLKSDEDITKFIDLINDQEVKSCLLYGLYLKSQFNDTFEEYLIIMINKLRIFILDKIQMIEFSSDAELFKKKNIELYQFINILLNK